MINLSLISPSSVGQYGACSARLVWDSQYPTARRSSSAADFGTVCHYVAMTMLGCGPLDPPSDAIMASASTRFASPDEMAEQAERCATAANAKLPPLNPGTKWLAELHVHDASLLPGRINRKGEKKGFGGSIDLLMSDNSHVVDYKFTGELPDRVKVEYLWQMACYSFLRDVPLTTLVFTENNGRSPNVVRCTIDWRLPHFVALRKSIRARIHSMGLDDFPRYAVPTAGDHCKWCDHKNSCGVAEKNLPVLEFNLGTGSPRVGLSSVELMRQQLALHKGMAQPTLEQAIQAAKDEAATPKLQPVGLPSKRPSPLPSPLTAPAAQQQDLF